MTWGGLIFQPHSCCHPPSPIARHPGVLPCPASSCQTHRDGLPTPPGTPPAVKAPVLCAQPALSPVTRMPAAAAPKQFLLTEPISAVLLLSRCFLAFLARAHVAGAELSSLFLAWGPVPPASVPGGGFCLVPSSSLTSWGRGGPPVSAQLGLPAEPTAALNFASLPALGALKG